jgi:uncharacterized protein (TIGR02646 family)
MRPVTKTNKLSADGSPLSFNDYKDAKPDLLKELGNYCSYCEREGYKSALHVEHVLPKSLPQYKQLETRWSNFLLACINCNAIKDDKNIDLSNTYLPHTDNLLTTIEITEGGVVKIKDNLPEEQLTKTRNFIDLTGIDRDPSHDLYSDNDDRWETRMRVWDTACQFAADYKNELIRLERIIDMAKYSGFWSVWFHAFSSYPEVKRKLIQHFPGTDANSFDENLNPITRPQPNTDH